MLLIGTKIQQKKEGTCMKPYAFGIDIGGTTIKMGFFNTDGTFVRNWEIPTRKEGNGEMILPDIARAIKKELADEKVSLDDIEGVGIGVPGPVLPDGTVNGCVNLGWGVVDVAGQLSSMLGDIDVKVGNDANVAALGEQWRGGGKGHENVVVVTLGTGVGGGIIIDGKIYSGSNYAGGELGHTVISMNGEMCTCGRHGCWEAYASATALINQTKQAMRRYPDSRMWELCENDINNVNGITAFNAMRGGDPVGRMVVDRYLEYVAVGISNVINIFQPEVVCIGGGISKEGETLTEPIKAFVEGENYARNIKQHCVIKTAALGNDAGIIGAAFLCNLYSENKA